MDKYSISIQWSDEDKGYIATVPELKGLSAFGTSKEDALNELQVAKEVYLEVFEEDGCELPGPDLLKNFSGQFRLRLPKSLHAYLSNKAEKEGVSLNTLIVGALSQVSNNESIVPVLKEGFAVLNEEVAVLKDEIKRLHVLTDYLYQKEVSTSWEIHDQKQPSAFVNVGQNLIVYT